MKHLKKLFIFALCAQAYTANAAMNWTQLEQGINNLKNIITSAVEKINVLSKEKEVAINELTILRNNPMFDPQEEVKFNAILRQLEQANSEFSNLILPNVPGGNQGGNVPGGNQGGNLELRQSAEDMEIEPVPSEVNNPPQLRMGSKEDLDNLTNLYIKIKGKLNNAPGKPEISQADKRVLEKAFKAAYPNENFPDFANKQKYLDYIYGIAEKYGQL